MTDQQTYREALDELRAIHARLRGDEVDIDTLLDDVKRAASPSPTVSRCDGNHSIRCEAMRAPVEASMSPSIAVARKCRKSVAPIESAVTGSAFCDHRSEPDAPGP